MPAQSRRCTEGLRDGLLGRESGRQGRRAASTTPLWQLRFVMGEESIDDGGAPLHDRGEPGHVDGIHSDGDDHWLRTPDYSTVTDLARFLG